jgi:hypothetical protein
MKSLLHTVSAQKIVSIAIISALLLYMLPFRFALAATVTSASDTMSNLTINATSSHSISFGSPTGVAQNTDTIIITFPSDFDFTGKVIGGLSLSHGSTTGLEVTETLAASASASDWGAAFSGTENRVLTLTAPTDGIGTQAITANNKIVIGYTATNSVNPSSPGSYTIAVTGAFGDTGEITVNILSNDQVSITATVPQSLTFSISDNSISFGNLSAVAARHASGTAAGQSTEVEAHNLIVGTNASNGYTMTVNGNTLTSGANTIDAIGNTNTASAVGTEQFGFRLTASGGNGAVVAPYAASGFAFNTGGLPDQVATSTSASANTTYSARYMANISASTEAGSYTATLTYVATANF